LLASDCEFFGSLLSTARTGGRETAYVLMYLRLPERSPHQSKFAEPHPTKALLSDRIRGSDSNAKGGPTYNDRDGRKQGMRASPDCSFHAASGGFRTSSGSAGGRTRFPSGRQTQENLESFVPETARSVAELLTEEVEDEDGIVFHLERYSSVGGASSEACEESYRDILLILQKSLSHYGNAFVYRPDIGTWPLRYGGTRSFDMAYLRKVKLKDRESRRVRRSRDECMQPPKNFA
jgi:hypothetical protein